jgi:hypothetical protein
MSTAPNSTRLLFIRCALYLSVCLCTVGGTANAYEWELKKQADGIDVYTRRVSDSDIKEFKGEGIVRVGVGTIVELLRDSAQFKDWFPRTSASALLERDGDVSYQYSVMSTPWPISDRDNIFRSVMARDEATGRVEITVEAAPDHYPVQKRLHRVTRANGSWLLTPNGLNETHVRFIMHLEPGGGIPDWMINTQIIATPFEALVNMRNKLNAGAKD